MAVPGTPAGIGSIASRETVIARARRPRYCRRHCLVQFNDGHAITLDGANPSLAGLTFNSGSNGYTIGQGTGGTLYLSNGANSASIAVSAGNQTINAPVGLVGSVVVTPAASSQLTISSAISGAGSSLTVNGGGTLILSGGKRLYRRCERYLRNARSGQCRRDSVGSSLVVGAGPLCCSVQVNWGAGGHYERFCGRRVSAGPVSAARVPVCGWRIHSTSVNGVQTAMKPVTPAPAVTSAALFTPQASPTQPLPLTITKFKPPIVTTDPAESNQTKAHDAVLQFWYTNDSAYGPKRKVLPC